MNLNSHLYIKIEKIDIYPCKVCPKAYTSLGELNKHIIRHDPSNIDLTDFKVLQHMTSAFVSLDRTKSFQCEHCGKYFQFCREYKLHKLTHIQQAANILLKASKNNNNEDGRFVKIYKCSECELRFVARSTLIAHGAAHEPFAHTCHCGIGYYTKYDLNSHLKLVHPNYIKPETDHQRNNIIKTKLGIFSKSKSKKAKSKSGKKIKRRLKITVPNENDVLIDRTDQNRYICPLCKRDFCSKIGVHIHLRSHTGEKPYTCNLCGNNFTQSGALKLHMKRHTGIKDFKCEYCNKGFYDKGSLLLHVRVHTKEKPYSCKYCNKPFSDPSALLRHHRTHTGVKPYQCPVCPKSYSDASALIAHKKRHTNSKVICHLCNKSFICKYNLELHFKTVHSNVKGYECSECGRAFALKSYLKLHINLRHTQKMYKCTKCKKPFGDKLGLIGHCSVVHDCTECKTGFPSNSHVIQHIYNGPGARFECDDCGMDFACKLYLVKHILHKHSTESCKICSLRFMSKLELAKHKVEGCIRCNICKVTFAYKTKLKEHVKLHNKKGKKKKERKVLVNFVCDLCGQGFGKRSSIINHIRQTHMEVLYCSVCLAGFFSDESLQRHKVNGCKPLKCEICDKVYRDQRRYGRHLKLHATKRHDCSKCDMTFVHVEDLNNHLIIRHSKK